MDTRILVWIAAVALTGCAAGGQSAPTSVTSALDTTAVRLPDSAHAPTTQATTTSEPYDESVRYPLEELPQRLRDTLLRQGGDQVVAQCLADQILAAYERGELKAVDLDEYARASTITASMEAFLLNVQADDVCTSVAG